MSDIVFDWVSFYYRGSTEFDERRKNAEKTKRTTEAHSINGRDSSSP
jgi:hypothetical protein